MHCPHCKSNDWTRIQIDLQADDTVKFLACRHCESRWWERGGSVIALDDVLALSSRKPR